MILDQNHHQVPDGTGVVFTLSSSGEGGLFQQVDSSTSQGIAHASFIISRPGILSIRASSDPANASNVLQLTVSNEGFSVSVATPTSILESTSTPMIEPTPIANVPSPITRGYTGFGGWLVMLMVLGGMAFLAYWYGGKLISVRWGIRWALCTFLGGLVMYNYLALQLPGAGIVIQTGGMVTIVGLVVVGSAGGLGAGFAWMRIANGKTKRSN
jgi:hypothetical protein